MMQHEEKGTKGRGRDSAALELRRATAQDSRLLWEWANDPTVRAMSFNEAQIAWEEHKEWFARKLADATCMIWIGLGWQGEPFGQIRFDGVGTARVEVDVSVAREFRGRGLGLPLIRAAVEQLELECGPQEIYARVKAENTASQRVFEAAGFVKAETELMKGQWIEHYIRIIAQDGADEVTRMDEQSILTERARKAQFLEGRIAENAASQEIDFIGWIFQHVQVAAGDAVLEVGCGNGAQTVKFVERVGDTGRVVALDVSADALAALKGKVSEAQRDRLTLVEANMDEIPAALSGAGLGTQKFDLVFCAYALYYSAEARKVLETVKGLLTPQGRIVIVGPFGPNNKPLFDLLKASGVTMLPEVTYSSTDFMNEVVVAWGAENFASLAIRTVVNRIHWNAPERILNYWKNSTFYDVSKLPEVQRRADAHFATEAKFTNEKWIMLTEMYDARG